MPQNTHMVMSHPPDTEAICVQPVVTPTPRHPLCRGTIAGPCRQLREKQSKFFFQGEQVTRAESSNKSRVYESDIGNKRLLNPPRERELPRQRAAAAAAVVTAQQKKKLLRSVSSRNSSSRSSAALRMMICRTLSRRTWGLWTAAATSGWQSSTSARVKVWDWDLLAAWRA
jgi:hypothetical protein